jgi:broad specificity phosphatase PhoE
LPNLILIKHSLPDIVQTLPANQWHLSQAGRDRCHTLAVKVAKYCPEVIVSSTEPKAAETAQILAGSLNRTYHMVNGLHEHDRRDQAWLGKQEFEKQVAEFFQHPQDLVLGKETANQAHERFSKTIMVLIDRYPQCNLAVVAHGTVITLFAARALGLEPFALWQSLGLPSFVVLSLPGLELVKIIESIDMESSNINR